MYSNNSCIVSLNVGGQIFTTTITTLVEQSPNSMLAAMFSGRHPICRDSNGNAFIDRDGDVFAHVINFLRTHKVFVAEDDVVLRRKIRTEAKYFQIRELQELLAIPIKINSQLLSKFMVTSFATMLPENWKTRCKMIYEIEDSLLSPAEFFSAVRTVNPFLVVIKASTGYILGAFCVRESKATFLFTFGKSDGKKPVKLNYSGIGEPVTVNENNGLALGGCDIVPPNSFPMPPDIGIYSNQCTCRTPRSFTTVDNRFAKPIGIGEHTLAGCAVWFIKRMEVFEVTHK